MRLACLCLIASWAISCSNTPPQPIEATSQVPKSTAPKSAAPKSTPVSPAPERIVAIGDLHGDYQATLKVLQIAGLRDVDGQWIGGKTTLVQTGDVLDRGDGEAAIYKVLFELQAQAKAAGGQVILLNGNHEFMNVQGDLRYVTPGAQASFGPDRTAAFAPGSDWAQRLAKHPTIAQVGDTVFAHGGVLPAHARYGIERINQEGQAWMLGKTAYPAALKGADSPIWTRLYGRDGIPGQCETLGTTLTALKAKRMVVGHTVQRGGPTSGCDGQLWRIDVGMSAHYGGAPAAIEITGDTVRVLTAGPN